MFPERILIENRPDPAVKITSENAYCFLLSLALGLRLLYPHFLHLVALGALVA